VRSVFPSPNGNSLPLRLKTNSSVSESSIIRILAINGEVIYNQQFQLSVGISEFSLPLLKRGIYFLESISPNGKISVSKFVQ
jgi:hypothetical protein